MRVELPFLAEGVEGGDVVQVLVHEGDQVTEGQSLIELETDKATVPVPAPAAGKITRLLVRQGDHLKVGQALVELEGADGEAQASKTSAPERPAIAPAPQPPPAVVAAHVHSVQQREGHKNPPSSPSEQPATEPVHAAPAADRVQSAAATIAAPPSVRRLARELGVDLTQVKGSEAGGRITAEDVKTYVRERTRRLGSPSSRDGIDKGGVFTTMYGSERREALPSIRRKIVATMTQAWTTIPHVHQFQDAD
ncbi:MAG TPA: biotin/lipoyl-containing protein, partial [Steroidobacteraceae bacterium]